MSRYRVAACIPLLVFVAGCVTSPTSNSPGIPLPSPKGIYILNEGLFGQGNSTLTYYDLQSDRVFQDVFFAANNRHLGDVGNSIAVRGGFGYIVVNNSHKIEIFDISTNASVGTIHVGAGRSPRQLAFVNDSVGLVTNLFDNSVLVLDLKNRTVVSRISVGENPDGIAIAAGKAFVANSGLGTGRTLSIIEVATMTLTRTMHIGDNPVEVQVTPEGLVYVLCAGFYNSFTDPNDDTPAKIYVLQPFSELVLDSILIGGHAFKLAIGVDGKGYVPTTDTVVILNTRFHRNAGAFVSGNFYSVGVDHSNGDVYLGDARNFTQPGAVLIYSANGQSRKQFDVGVNPTAFAFKF